MGHVRPRRGGRGRFHALWIALALTFPGVAQAQSVADIDPATGTPRMLARLDGTRTGPASGSPLASARAYVEAHPATLGITQSDLDAMEAPVVRALPGDVSSVRWRQASDHELRVNVAADGRVLNVLGSPVHDYEVAGARDLSAGEAVRAVQDEV